MVFDIGSAVVGFIAGIGALLGLATLLFWLEKDHDHKAAFRCKFCGTKKVIGESPICLRQAPGEHHEWEWRE